jgi:hypothetical protein
MGALAAVAAAPASAGTITIFGVTATCENQMPQAAKYTITYGTHSFTFTIPGAKCLF